MTRNGKSSLLISPDSVLANALPRTIDLLRPRVLAARPTRIEFVVGTQVNGAPHLGTNLVQTAAFLLARTARREFSIDTVVRFGALDNAPHDVVLDPETHHAYQQTYFHALGKDKIAPSHGAIHIRLPCSECGWAEKRADRTELTRLDEDGATFSAVCLDHGGYETHVDPEDAQPYLDLATLYRNLVKERAFGRDTDVLHVMMKGGDRAFGCQLVDGTLCALGTPAAQMPVRIFTPQVLAPTGARSPSRSSADS